MTCLDRARGWGRAQKAKVASFCGAGVGGNRHHLIYLAQADRDHCPLPDELRQVPNLILLQGDPSALQAQFWNLGQAVRRCGSGNIAIAAFARQYLFNSELFSLQLQTPAGSILLGHDRAGPFYFSQAEAQYPVAHPALWRHLLGGNYAAGAFFGGASDYALLELDRPPAQLHLSATRLRRFSKRALIALYSPSPEKVLMRYFAPQYGSDEDAATGSGAVQAAEYLWRRYRWRVCRITQQSASGGLIETHKLARKVRVRGAARVNEFPGADFSSECSMPSRSL